MWSKFVDCIRRYISNCFEESRRALFHKSVENSIDTVHAICSSKMYQNGSFTPEQKFRSLFNWFLLQCRVPGQGDLFQTGVHRLLRSQLSAADWHCGEWKCKRWPHLLVSSGSNHLVSELSVKVSRHFSYYAQFKNCVNRPLLEECGRKAKNLMDHSMSFLISRCNYYSSQM